jgi:hypothetical protein
MKKLLPLFLLLAACGSEHATSVSPTATPTPQVSTTPSPSPAAQGCADIPLIGIWEATASNELKFSEDCTATVGAQKLEWSVKDEAVSFSSGKISVDSCDYQITSIGGLSSPLVISLKLNCDKSGLLNYTKKN